MGNSDKGDNLVDCLLECIDDIRECVHGTMGTREFCVFAVRRRWSGGYIGDGEFTDEETELTPKPQVHPFSNMGYNQQPCGLDEAGWVKVTEVSLCWDFHDLVACEADDGVQHLIKIVDAHGQHQPVRYFAHAKPPYPDRHETIGWILYLQHLETGECPSE